ncbi:transposase [Zymomonas mobilis]|uniref:transposase n=1 Tax=Zymomonas mobilis TaxID=542 RepID=UPI0039ECEE31
MGTRGWSKSALCVRSDGGSLPLAFILTSGEVSDYSGSDSLIDIPVTTPRCFLADKGYDNDRLREKLLFRGIFPIIPPRSNRKKPILYNLQSHKDRNRIERMFKISEAVQVHCHTL